MDHARRPTFCQPTRSEPARSEPARLEVVLRHVVAVGVVVLLLVPEARGSHAVIGWLPMWLFAMPACAWWVARRMGRQEPEATVARRSRVPMARRFVSPAPRGKRGRRTVVPRAA
ncbi:MAG: hypothetical protein R3278_09255 [Lysobacter spongiicola]|nr:hypothetical protein [Lysobacter spongiicola]